LKRQIPPALIYRFTFFRAEYTRAIFQLENIDYEDEFAYEQANKAFQSIDHIPVFIDKVDANTKICRSRTHLKNQEFFEKINDIFIPPEKIVTSYARCNKPFQSKLYGSENRPT